MYKRQFAAVSEILNVTAFVNAPIKSACSISAESLAVTVPAVANIVFVLCEILCAVSEILYVFVPVFLAASIISASCTVGDVKQLHL